MWTVKDSMFWWPNTDASRFQVLVALCDSLTHCKLGTDSQEHALTCKELHNILVKLKKKLSRLLNMKIFTEKPTANYFPINYQDQENIQN